MTLVGRSAWNSKAPYSSGSHIHAVLEPALFLCGERKPLRGLLDHPQDLLGNGSMLGQHHRSGEDQRFAIEMEHRDATRSQRSNAGGTNF